MKRYLSKSDAWFIGECLEWNMIGYQERAAKYLHGDCIVEGYKETVYDPTLKEMKKYIDWMNEIKRVKKKPHRS